MSQALDSTLCFMCLGIGLVAWKAFIAGWHG